MTGRERDRRVLTIPVVTCDLVKKDRLIPAEYRLLIRDHIRAGREKQIQEICICFYFLNSTIFQLFCELGCQRQGTVMDLCHFI